MGSSRVAAVVAGPPTTAMAAAFSAAGLDAGALSLAMLEDVLEILGGLEAAGSALVIAGEPSRPGGPDLHGADGWLRRAAELPWPTTTVVRLPAVGTATLSASVDELAKLGAAQVAVVAPDAPDLPALLVGKLFRALGHAEVAACPARDGGLTAFAARTPIAPWAASAEVELDTADAVDRLAAAAPRRRDFEVGPGWHRIRAPADLGDLDPGLEGWEATRLLVVDA